MTEAELMGYVRRSKKGGALNVSVSTDAFARAERYQTQDGKEYVGMIINLSSVQDLLEGRKEVTGISQIKAN